MEWIPKNIEHKLVVVSTTPLASFDEEKCKYCGRFGCTDRGYSLTIGEPPVMLSEAEYAQRLNDCLTRIVVANQDTMNICIVNYDEPQCVRKLKKSNVEAVLERMSRCNEDCIRNRVCTQGGEWKKRAEGYHCLYRNENYFCMRNMSLDHSPLFCLPNKEGCISCEYHEEAYSRCFKKDEGKPCYDMKMKLGVTDEKKDHLLLLAHRFQAAPCLHCEEGTCKNEASMHSDGACTLKGLMAPCEHYESVSSGHAYIEGVCTYVSSFDGKDDRKIFPSSDYAHRLSDDGWFNLRLACRISHSIAKATGLKCNGVRRSTGKPFLNDKNPLSEHAIEIDYLYLTHPEDVARYNPELIAQAVYEALYKNCAGLGCDEMENCNINRRQS